MCVAFPRSEYYQRVRLPLQFPPSCGWSFQKTYSVPSKTATDLPGPLPFPSVRTMLSDPAGVSSHLAFCGGLLVPSRLSTLSASGCFHEAQSLHLRYGPDSLCLRLACVVAFTSPRLDSRWSGFAPFRSGILTR